MCMVIDWMGNGTVASYIVAQRKEGRLHDDDYIKTVDLWVREARIFRGSFTESFRSSIRLLVLSVIYTTKDWYTVIYMV